MQNLKVEMDPRSSATSVELDEQLRLGLEIFGEVRRSRRAVTEISAVKKRLDEVQQKIVGHRPELLKQVTELQAAIAKIEKGSGPAMMGLEAANTGLASALRVVEGGDRTTPSQAVELYRQSDEAAKARIAEWTKLRSTELLRLNNALQKGGVPPIQVSEIEHEVESLVSQ